MLNNIMFRNWEVSKFSGNTNVDSTTFYSTDNEFEYIWLSIFYRS